MNTGPGTDEALFEYEDEPEIDEDEWDYDGRDAQDVEYDNEHSPACDHPDY